MIANNRSKIPSRQPGNAGSVVLLLVAVLLPVAVLVAAVLASVVSPKSCMLVFYRFIPPRT